METMNWIKVSDELPEITEGMPSDAEPTESVDVLVTDMIDIAIGYLERDQTTKELKWVVFDGSLDGEVTHWAKIDLPKE